MKKNFTTFSNHDLGAFHALPLDTRYVDPGISNLSEMWRTAFPPSYGECNLAPAAHGNIPNKTYYTALPSAMINEETVYNYST